MTYEKRTLTTTERSTIAWRGGRGFEVYWGQPPARRVSLLRRNGIRPRHFGSKNLKNLNCDVSLPRKLLLSRHENPQARRYSIATIFILVSGHRNEGPDGGRKQERRPLRWITSFSFILTSFCTVKIHFLCEFNSVRFFSFACWSPTSKCVTPWRQTTSQQRQFTAHCWVYFHVLRYDETVSALNSILTTLMKWSSWTPCDHYECTKKICQGALNK